MQLRIFNWKALIIGEHPRRLLWMMVVRTAVARKYIPTATGMRRPPRGGPGAEERGSSLVGSRREARARRAGIPARRSSCRAAVRLRPGTGSRAGAGPPPSPGARARARAQTARRGPKAPGLRASARRDEAFALIGLAVA